MNSGIFTYTLAFYNKSSIAGAVPPDPLYLGSTVPFTEFCLAHLDKFKLYLHAQLYVGVNIGINLPSSLFFS